jgi:hypothetical protein
MAVQLDRGEERVKVEMRDHTSRIVLGGDEFGAASALKRPRRHARRRYTTFPP